MGDEGAAEQRLTKVSFYAQVGGPLVVDLNEAIDILTEENASLRAEVARRQEALPATFYADRDLHYRLERMVSEWQRVILANQQLEEQVARLQERTTEQEAAFMRLAKLLGNPTLEAGPDSSLEMELVKLAEDQIARLEKERDGLAESLQEVLNELKNGTYAPGALKRAEARIRELEESKK